MNRWLSYAISLICLLIFLIGPGFGQPTQKFSLGTTAGFRFNVTNIVWPANHSDASACLWANDKLSALTITIDDNNAGDHPWWMAQGDTLGWHFTWFVITGLVNGPNSYFGTWSQFRALFAHGDAVQSHSVAHGDTSLFKQLYGIGDYTKDWYDYYYGSKKIIEDSIPGDKCYTLGAPGSGTNNLDSAAAYYIADRGTVAYPQRASQINFKDVRSSSAWDTMHVLTIVNKTTLVWGQNYYRGLASFHIHGVPEANRPAVRAFLYYIKALDSLIWVATFPDMARYNMEYATHKLTKSEASDTLIRYALTDSMADSIYTYPLTIKVRLNSDWQNARTTQNGTAIPCSLITYQSNLYALIKAVPDKGEIKLAKVGSTGITSQVLRPKNDLAKGNKATVYNLLGRHICTGLMITQGFVSNDVTDKLQTGIYLFKTENSDWFEKRLIVR